MATNHARVFEIPTFAVEKRLLFVNFNAIGYLAPFFPRSSIDMLG
jgi:hypothetical protein